jgi:hypothetical protein
MKNPYKMLVHTSDMCKSGRIRLDDRVKYLYEVRFVCHLLTVAGLALRMRERAYMSAKLNFCRHYV